MIAIVNTDLNWGIGKEGDLQVHISNDLKRFKELTTGKVIIYGSKTLETYPKQKALPNRHNIILSRRQELIVENAEIVHTIKDLLKRIDQLKEEKNFKDNDFIVVGGESIYKQLLPYCTACYVTKMQIELEADAYFPNLNELSDWSLESESEKYFDSKNQIYYSFLIYKKVKEQ